MQFLLIGGTAFFYKKLYKSLVMSVKLTTFALANKQKA